MIDPLEQAKLDQCMTQMTDLLPSIWWNLYIKCKEEGFNEAQAFELVKTFIIANGTGDKNPA